MCPSDPSGPATGANGGMRSGGEGFQGNYVVCAGDRPMNATTDIKGMFYGHSRHKMRDMKDGSSNTAFLSEVIIRGSSGGGWGGGGGYWGGGRGGGYGFITEEPPNTTLPDQIYQRTTERDRHNPGDTERNRGFQPRFMPGFASRPVSMALRREAMSLPTNSGVNTHRYQRSQE